MIANVVQTVQVEPITKQELRRILEIFSPVNFAIYATNFPEVMNPESYFLQKMVDENDKDDEKNALRIKKVSYQDALGHSSKGISIDNVDVKTYLGDAIIKKLKNSPLVSHKDFIRKDVVQAEFNQLSRS